MTARGRNVTYGELRDEFLMSNNVSGENEQPNAVDGACVKLFGEMLEQAGLCDDRSGCSPVMILQNGTLQCNSTVHYITKRNNLLHRTMSYSSISACSAIGGTQVK